MALSDRPRGIAGLEGRTPVGAVLTVGRKRTPQDGGGRAGVPILRDRWFLMQPDPAPVSGVKGGIRPQHPSFGPFNSAGSKRVIGRLVHPTAADAWEHYLRAQAHGDTGSMTPSRRPWCEGDGHRAHRIEWDDDGTEHVTEIVCPHDRCPYRQARPRLGPACKPFGRLLFQVGWEGRSAQFSMPTPLVKWSTRSWHSIRNLIGFFDYIEQSAANLGIERPSLIGFPFELTLQERTDREQHRFPVVRAAPLSDPLTFFAESAQARATLIDVHRPVGLLAGPERTPQVEVDDWQQNVPGLHAEVIDADAD